MSAKLKPVDALVVGAGLAGTIVCKELAATGLKIVCLERGRRLDSQHDLAMPYVHDELKYERASDIVQNLSRQTITFRNSMNETALPMREIGSFKPGECVGGAGVHWGGMTQRFLPWDFETRSRTLERYGKQQMPEDCTSAYPQNSANSPTGTVGALACWAADSIKDHYLKRPGALV